MVRPAHPRRLLPLFFVVLSSACGGGGSGSPGPEVSASLAILPFATPLDGVRVQPSNSNLDLVRHDGRTYFAFRTSSSYFPATQSEIQVVSAEGTVRWEHELTLEDDDDLRDPRFLAWNGQLFLFFARFATGSSALQPLGALVTTLDPEDGWSEPVDVLDPGLVVSHLYVHQGLPYMTAWRASGDALEVHFLRSNDGVSWSGASTAGPVVQVGGGSETALLFRDDGSLLAVTVNERGDELGWGSHICVASQIDAAWTCRGDPRRFDGAAIFVQDDVELMVARRNVSDTGAYDLGREDLPEEERTAVFLDDYDGRRKRCALWALEGADAPALITDLPSRGDTCSPSLVREDAHRVAVYYQSSPLAGPDLTLREGLAGPSTIQRVVVSF